MITFRITDDAVARCSLHPTRCCDTKPRDSALGTLRRLWSARLQVKRAAQMEDASALVLEYES